MGDDGPAKAAGIEVGDILVKANGVYVREMSTKDLLKLFGKRPLLLLFAPAKGSRRERLCALRADDERRCCFEDEKHSTCYSSYKDKGSCVDGGGEWCGYEAEDFDL